MAREQDAEHVEHLALEPVGRGVHGNDRGHHVGFIDRHLQPDAVVLVHRQEVVDQIEARRAVRMVDGRDVDQRGKATTLIGLEKFNKLYQTRQRHVQGQLALGNLAARHGIGPADADMRGKLGQRLQRLRAAVAGGRRVGLGHGGAPSG